jgi:hypothetical protein
MGLKRSLLLLTLAMSFASAAFAISCSQAEAICRRLARIGSQWQLVEWMPVYDPQRPHNVTGATFTFQCDYQDGSSQTRRVRIFFEPLNQVDMDYVRDGRATDITPD